MKPTFWHDLMNALWNEPSRKRSSVCKSVSRTSTIQFGGAASVLELSQTNQIGEVDSHVTRPRCPGGRGGDKTKNVISTVAVAFLQLQSSGSGPETGMLLARSASLKLHKNSNGNLPSSWRWRLLPGLSWTWRTRPHERDTEWLSWCSRFFLHPTLHCRRTGMRATR